MRIKCCDLQDCLFEITLSIRDCQRASTMFYDVEALGWVPDDIKKLFSSVIFNKLNIPSLLDSLITEGHYCNTLLGITEALLVYIKHISRHSIVWFVSYHK